MGVIISTPKVPGESIKSTEIGADPNPSPVTYPAMTPVAPAIGLPKPIITK